MEKECECGIREYPAKYSKGNNDTNALVEGAFNFVIENKGTTVVTLNNYIDLQPFGLSGSVRTFIGNSKGDKYSENLSIGWAANAIATDSILVICTMEDNR